MNTLAKAIRERGFRAALNVRGRLVYTSQEQGAAPLKVLIEEMAEPTLAEDIKARAKLPVFCKVHCLRTDFPKAVSPRDVLTFARPAELDREPVNLSVLLFDESAANDATYVWTCEAERL